MTKKNASFNILDFLEKKKNGHILSKEEIELFIQNLVKGKIKDYQASAFLMACCINGLNSDETSNLTNSMKNSGKILVFNDKKVIDKHSTGGIGDKASFILGPIAQSCGVKIPMIAGRGLGHTGGTIDKIECIKGFNTSLPLKEFKKNVLKYGLALIGQTAEIAPADKLLYALRDVTATVDNIPLITASIMSKKLAEGANGIVMDVKWGTGAFMSTQEQAINLANSLIKTANFHNKKMVVVVSDMNQPLGHAIGHSLEIIESVKTLKNQGPKDLTELSLILAAHMVHMAGLASNYNDAYQKAKNALESGEAYKNFEKMVKRQGGDLAQIRNLDLLPLASKKSPLFLKKNGYIQSLNNKELGKILIELGGGRKTQSDKIDFSVGLEITHKIGDKTDSSTPIGHVYYHKNQIKIVEKIQEQIQDIFKVSPKPIKTNPLVAKIIKGKII
jgi:pyrimidine-nucleoside phosphorylase